MQDVRVFSTDYCGYCQAAKRMLDELKVPYREVDVTDDDEQRAWLVRATGRRTVPQIFIGEEPIGGYTDLQALHRAGKLFDKLKANSGA